MPWRDSPNRSILPNRSRRDSENRATTANTRDAGTTATGATYTSAGDEIALRIEGSALTSTVNPDDQADEMAMTLDATSTWSLTADAYVTAFAGSLDSVVGNGFTLYVNGVAAN